MGTTKSGRYLNTEGSETKVSDFALVHAIEGAFTRSLTRDKGKAVFKLRLSKGGHGQKNIELLEKYGIEYHIIKTYPNGVRIGNVPRHMHKAKKKETGQSWFPESWTENDIRRAGEYVAGLKGNHHVADKDSVFGVYKGVRVGVKRTFGKIATIFPDSDQSAVIKEEE